MMKYVRSIIGGFAAAVLGSAVMASMAAAQEQSKLDEVLDRGHVVVGVTSEAPPFGFINEDGELVGFDIDIARLVARAIFDDDSDDRIELKRQSFAARWANTQSGQIDFGVQVTTIYPDRAVRVAFTRPYIDSGITLVVSADSDIQKPSDLNSSEYTVAHLTAPVQDERGERHYPEANVVTFDSVSAQFTAVRAQRADAAQLDVPIALYYAKDHPDIRVLDQWLTEPTNNAIFLRQGDFKWWLFLDTIVGEMRGGSLFSEYADIYEKWFGTRPVHAKHYVSGD
jgi:polar amino acid transport system substrate-binding protein